MLAQSGSSLLETILSGLVHGGCQALVVHLVASAQRHGVKHSQLPPWTYPTRVAVEGGSDRLDGAKSAETEAGTRLVRLLQEIQAKRNWNKEQTKTETG